MDAYIYKIINVINGKFYIGSTLNFEKRQKQHIEQLRRQRHHCLHLQNAFKEYGEENFIFECRKVNVKDVKQLHKLEERYIQLCWNSGELYNCSKKAGGGDNVTTSPKYKEFCLRQTQILNERYSNMTLEERQRLSNIKKGELNGNFGNKWSDEQRKLLSEKKIQYFQENEHHYKGKTWEELFGEEKAKVLKEKLSQRSKDKVGELNSFFGKHHTDETKEKLRQKNKGKIPQNRKKVLCNGVIYDSATDCAEKLKIHITTVSYRARKGLYGFSYIENNEENDNA